MSERLNKAADMIQAEIDAAVADGAQAEDVADGVAIVKSLRECSRTDLDKAVWMDVLHILGYANSEWTPDIANMLEVSGI